MKKVWSSPSLVQCDLLKSILEGDGIICVIKNEYNARAAGIGYPLFSGQSLAFAWPELWVPDDQYEEASEVVDAFTKGHEETIQQGESDSRGD
jgi:hypothetical protein